MIHKLGMLTGIFRSDMGATKVIARYPQLTGDGYVKEVWTVGEKRVNPAGDMDLVKAVYMGEPWVQIDWVDFGSEYISHNIITTIELRNARYTEIQAAKKRDRKPEDTARVKKVLGQNPL